MGRALEKKLIDWSIVRMDKKNESLGTKNPFVLNMALLGKWSWRFASKREAP